MDLISAAVNLNASLALAKVQYAVAAKVLDNAHYQGQAAVELIEAAAQLMEQASAEMLNATEGLSASLDVLA